MNIPPLNPDLVSLIIGTDFPKMQIRLNFPSRKPHQFCAVKTKLSWILTFKRSILPLYRNQSVDLLFKSTDWFLCDGSIGC